MIPALLGLIGVACTSVLALGVVNYSPDGLGVHLSDSVATQPAVAAPDSAAALDAVISGFEIAHDPRETSSDTVAPHAERRGGEAPKPAGKHAARPPKPGRVYRVTAYCDRGWTASGTRVGVGQCAAPVDIPFGSRIYIPQLGRTFVVTDRTSYRFRRNTVDIFMPAEAQCWRFGRQYLECHVTPPVSAAQRVASR
jgi:3D (Asp-Asp-Asp) domain-containing protein